VLHVRPGRDGLHAQPVDGVAVDRNEAVAIDGHRAGAEANLPALAEERVAVRVEQRTVRAQLKRATAGEPLALRRRDDEEAIAVGGDIGRRSVAVSGAGCDSPMSRANTRSALKPAVFALARLFATISWRRS
jgi:hypothetical protein